MNARGSKRLFPFIFQSISPFKSYLIFSVFVSIIGAVDLSLRPYFLKMALDSAKLQDKLEYNEKFLTYIFLYLISMSVMFAVNTVYEYMWIDFFPRFRRSIGNLVFQELIEQSYTFYQNNFLGSLGQRLNNCIGPIPRIIKALNEDFFKNTLAIAISVYALGYISFKYSAALIIWASIYICCAVILSSRVKEKSIITAKEASRGMGYIIDVLNNMMSIKLFHGKAFETEKVDENFKEWEKCVKSRDILLVHLNTFQTITFFIFQAVCIYWMIETDVKTNKITPGDLESVT